MTTHLILIRHGETTWNSEGRVQGWLDLPLNERGLQQAELLAERLKCEHADAIYASTLQRARMTAEHIGCVLNLPVQLDERLREHYLGEIQGLTDSEIRAKFPEWVAQVSSAGSWVTAPGGESLEDFIERVCGCCDELMKRHCDQTLIIVSHGGTINRLLMHWLGIDGRRFAGFELSNASLSRVSHDGIRFRVRSLNDTHHLTRPSEQVGTTASD